MSLTTAEENRLYTLETAVNRLAILIKGAGSKNQLNRLLILAQQETGKVDTRLQALEAKIDTLITLAQKLQ